MKKLTILLIVLIAFTGVVGAADFRDVNWGMSKTEVIGREGQPAYEDEYMLAYKTKLFGHEFALGYMFYENTLTDARYMLVDDPTGSEYKYLIEDLASSLNDKYGENQTEGIVWLDDKYKNEITNFDTAVSVGDVMARYTYETEDLDVLFGVMGENYEDSFYIMYTPKDTKLERLRKQRTKERKSKSQSQL